MEAEEEIDIIFDQQETKHLKQLAEAEKDKKEAETREQSERLQKEEEQRQKVSLAVKLASYMKQNGASSKDISEQTGLSPDIIIGL